ncbi:hypothetical protein [Lysinibacillus cavernae]|uniref:hypothetical protein n=1 Tax=Lysinibacillus cavernae TaxID=2666135 RepID=UPI0012D9A0E6|nr:hypothetical protein [Lysinibacillus cavernae]
MKKISTILTAALLTASIGGASSALAANSTSIPSISVTSSTVTEVPNVKFIDEDNNQNSIVITPYAVILETSASFPTGQGSLNFSYKAPASGTEKVQVFVQNNSAKTINVKMVSQVVLLGSADLRLHQEKPLFLNTISGLLNRVLGHCILILMMALRFQ